MKKVLIALFLFGMFASTFKFVGRSRGDIPESDETNNQKEITVTVHDTTGLNIAYVQVVHENEEAGPVNYFETIEKGSDFILGTYPIAPTEFIVGKFPDAYTTLPNRICSGALSRILCLYRDFINVFNLGRRLSDGRADRVVGILNSETSYFVDRTGCRKRGLTFGNPFTGQRSHSVLVLDGEWIAPAHEIGHTYGLNEEYTIRKTNSGPCDVEVEIPGVPARGFWIEGPPGEAGFREGLGFMGASPGPRTFGNRWVSNDSYEKLFKKFLVNRLADPEVLLLSGIIMPDGSVEFGTFYQFEDGVADQIQPGEFTLQLFDLNGTLVDSIKFSVLNTAFLEEAFPITFDAGYFAFSVPYPEDSQILRIEKDGVVISELSITTRLLHDAVDLIPDSGFINNPAQRRNALHNKVNALENQLKVGDVSGAVQKLRYDIKPILDRWLVDDYQVETPLQYSKREILELVDILIARLGG